MSLFGMSTQSAERSRTNEINRKRKEHQHDRAQTEQRLRNED
jgi:hypothetical protein